MRIWRWSVPAFVTMSLSVAALAAAGEQVAVGPPAPRSGPAFAAQAQAAAALPAFLRDRGEGLPLSMQVIGAPFDEMAVFRVAAAYEDARGPIPQPQL